MILSILISSLEERARSFEYIHNKLLSQIEKGGLVGKVEVLTFIDNRENSTGHKRNSLKNTASGLYVCNVDDDDDVSDDYVSENVNAIEISNADIITFITDKYTDGKFDYKIRPSMNFDGGMMVGEGYNRVLMTQPTHLCPHKKSLADQITYPNLYRMADYGYEVELKKLIKTEHHIDKTLYIWKDSSFKIIPNI